jgi:hypothetical protein
MTAEGIESTCARLDAGTPRSDFDCRGHSVQEFFRQRSWTSEVNDWARTFVLLATDEDRAGGLPPVLGFYTLCMGRLTVTDMPEAPSPPPFQQALPTALLAQLGRDVRVPKERAIGEMLMGDAFRRVARVADSIGCVGLMLHAENAALVPYYARYGFIPLRRPLQMYLPIGTIRNAIAQAINP